CPCVAAWTITSGRVRRNQASPRRCGFNPTRRLGLYEGVSLLDTLDMSAPSARSRAHRHRTLGSMRYDLDQDSLHIARLSAGSVWRGRLWGLSTPLTELAAVPPPSQLSAPPL